MQRVTWVKEAVLSLWSFRSHWAWVVLMLLLAWSTRQHFLPLLQAALYAGGIYIATLTYRLYTGTNPRLMSLAVKVFSPRPTTGKEAAALLQIVFGLGLIIGGFLAIRGLQALILEVPKRIGAFAERHGKELDVDLLSVLIAATVLGFATAIWVYALSRQLKNNRTIPTYRCAAIQDARETGREYAWLLLTIVVALLPAALRMSWPPNVIASVVVPAFIVWFRRYRASLERTSYSVRYETEIKRTPSWLRISVAYFFWSSFFPIVVRKIGLRVVLPFALVVAFASGPTLHKRIYFVIVVLIIAYVYDLALPFSRATRETRRRVVESPAPQSGNVHAAGFGTSCSR